MDGLRDKVFRYLSPTRLFRDASRGTELEQAAAWRFNKEHAGWLLVYMRRWAVIAVACMLAGWVTEAAPWASAVFYSGAAASVAVNSVLGVSLAWLKRMQ